MPIRMDWSNSLPNALARSFYASDAPWIARVAISPGPEMRANGGMQSFELDNPIQGFIHSEEIIYCSWQAQGYWFGTRIVLPQQVAHAGYSPYYQIAGSATTPASAESIVWRTPVSDPSLPYLYSAASDQLPSDLNIQCLPVAGGIDFSLQVNVTAR